MSDLDEGMACIQRTQELEMPTEDKGKLLAQRITDALEMARVIFVMHEDNEGPILQYPETVCAL